MNHSHLLLALATLGLLVGPLVGSLGGRSQALRSVVDRIAMALVGGLCLFFVLPHAVADLGLIALALALLGAALPSLGHRLLAGRRWSLALVSLALAAHVILDGAALTVREGNPPLAWAVVAHRVPVSFAIVVATQGFARSGRVAWGLALAMVAATFVGYAGGPVLAAALPEPALVGFEALVAGVLMHVVFSPHGGDHGGDRASAQTR